MPLDIERLRRSLSAARADCPRRCGFEPELSYGRHRGPAPATAARAAVLLLLYPDESEWWIPLVLRPTTMIHHAGQIGLPGGRCHPGESAADCALRETREELGVASRSLELLGPLPQVHVYGSNFLVQPLVASAPLRPNFCPDACEVAELLELRVEQALAASGDNTWIERYTTRFRAPCLRLGDRAIWGATAIILGQFATIAREVVER